MVVARQILSVFAVLAAGASAFPLSSLFSLSKRDGEINATTNHWGECAKKVPWAYSTNSCAKCCDDWIVSARNASEGVNATMSFTNEQLTSLQRQCVITCPRDPALQYKITRAQKQGSLDDPTICYADAKFNKHRDTCLTCCGNLEHACVQLNPLDPSQCGPQAGQCKHLCPPSARELEKINRAVTDPNICSTQSPFNQTKAQCELCCSNYEHRCAIENRLNPEEQQKCGAKGGACKAACPLEEWLQYTIDRAVKQSDMCYKEEPHNATHDTCTRCCRNWELACDRKKIKNPLDKTECSAIGGQCKSSCPLPQHLQEKVDRAVKDYQQCAANKLQFPSFGQCNLCCKHYEQACVLLNPADHGFCGRDGGHCKDLCRDRT